MRLFKEFNKILIALVVLLAFPACAEKLSPVVVHTKNGAEMYQVEIARTPEEMALGLMNRKNLPADQGMLFIFEDERVATFWMHNTLIPLDMLFIDAKGVIQTIHAMAKPLDETPLSSTVPIIAVLEINGGQALQKGIKIGDSVETSLLSGANVK